MSNDPVLDILEDISVQKDDTVTIKEQSAQVGDLKRNRVVVFFSSSDEDEDESGEKKKSKRKVVSVDAPEFSEDFLSELKKEADEMERHATHRNHSDNSPTNSGEFPNTGVDGVFAGLDLGLPFAEDLTPLGVSSLLNSGEGAIGEDQLEAVLRSTLGTNEANQGPQRPATRRIKKVSAAPKAEHLPKRPLRIFKEESDGEDAPTDAPDPAEDKRQRRVQERPAMTAAEVDAEGNVVAVAALGGYCLTLREEELFGEDAVFTEEEEEEVLREPTAVVEEETVAKETQEQEEEDVQDEEAKTLDGDLPAPADDKEIEDIDFDDDDDEDEEDDEEDEDLDAVIIAAVVQQLVDCCEAPDLDPSIARAAEHFCQVAKPLLAQLSEGTIEHQALAEQIDRDLRRFTRIFKSVYRPRDEPIVIDGKVMDM